jgi:hypothetical protein
LPLFSSLAISIGCPIHRALCDGCDRRTSISHNAFCLPSHPKRTVISTEVAHAFREQRSGEIRFFTSNVAPTTHLLLTLQHTLEPKTFSRSDKQPLAKHHLISNENIAQLIRSGSSLNKKR